MELNSLTSKLFDAIQDPQMWHDALGSLCAFTNTSRALISLRDKKTASIIIPDDVSTAFASPLIYGFSEAEVEAFLSDFGEIDPWTAIEKEHHPYFPYCMSRYLPPAQLKRTEFWSWLVPMGISDCLVCEIGETDSYWAALNLYFDPEDEAQVEATLTELKQVLPVLKSAWRTGRELQLAKTSADSFDIILSAIPEPAAMVSHDGELIAQNEQMARFLKSNEGGKEDFAIPSDLTLKHSGSAEKLTLKRSAPSGLTAEVHVRAHKAFQLKDGENRNTYLLTIGKPSHPHRSTDAPIWEHASLTKRESTLVQLTAEGLKFSEAHVKMGVSYPRVMQIWKSARGKLGIKDVHELRVAHELNNS